MKGALPPSSSDTFLHGAGALGHELLTDPGRAGESQLSDHGVGCQLAADFGGRGAGDNVENTGGNAGARASSAIASAE